MINWLQLYYC